MTLAGTEMVRRSERIKIGLKTMNVCLQDAINACHGEICETVACRSCLVDSGQWTVDSGQ